MKETQRENGLTLLFPGSFNPIHIGHLALANYVCECYADEVEALWFLPSPRNPLKSENSLLPDALRTEAVQASIAGYSKFSLCRIEETLPKPSYTIRTVEALQERYPRRRFALLIGSDNLATLPRWHRIEQLLPKIELWVYPRPSYPMHWPEDLSPRARWRAVEAPQLEVSSSFIRQSIALGRRIPFFLPAPLRSGHLYASLCDAIVDLSR